MHSQPKLQASTLDPVNTVDKSILGVFAGTGFSLFGFLILIVLLA
jgi:hypothetical protein